MVVICIKLAVRIVKVLNEVRVTWVDPFVSDGVAECPTVLPKVGVSRRLVFPCLEELFVEYRL